METNHLFELSNVKGEDRVYLTLHILKKILESGQLNISNYTKNTRIIEDSNKTMLPTCGNNILAKLASGLYSFCYNGLPSVWSGDSKSNENIIESYIENITLDTMEENSPEQLLQIFIVYANCVQGYSKDINDYFVEKILEVIPDQFYTRLGLMLDDNINVEIPAIDIETESFEIKDMEQYKKFLKDQKALEARNGITIPSAIFNIRANSVTLLSPSQVNDHINEEHTNIDKFENIVEKEVVQIPQETMVEIEKKVNEEPVKQEFNDKINNNFNDDFNDNVDNDFDNEDDIDDNEEDDINDYYNVDYPEVSEDYNYGNFDSLRENEVDDDDIGDNEVRNNGVENNDYESDNDDFDDFDNESPENNNDDFDDFENENNNDFDGEPEEPEEPENDDDSFESDGEQNVEPENNVDENNNNDLLSDLNSQVEESSRINEIQPVESDNENSYNFSDLEEPENEGPEGDADGENDSDNGDNDNYNFSDLDSSDYDDETYNSDNDIFKNNNY